MRVLIAAFSNSDLQWLAIGGLVFYVLTLESRIRNTEENLSDLASEFDDSDGEN